MNDSIVAGKTSVENMLASGTDQEIASTVVHGLPWIFAEESEGAYQVWRSAIVAGTGVSADGVYIVGSAALGFSLVAEKAGRKFKRPAPGRRPSDIDIAMVDEALFVKTWETIVAYDRRRALRLSYDRLDRLRRGVYWGFLTSTFVPANTSASRLLRQVLSASQRIAPLRGHPSSIRIYRRDQDLMKYQEHSVKSLRRELLKGESQ
jgi:hypothetical protein